MLMKRYTSYIAVFAMMLVAGSCSKLPGVFPNRRELIDEIVLDMGPSVGIVMGNETKATPVTSIPSTLYWGATTGTRGATSGSGVETKKWLAASATVSDNKISTGKYQTATPTAYNYYVSNRSFNVPDTGNLTMTVSDNSSDIVVGWLAGSTSSTPSVTLNHIFARTGSLSVSAPSGYTATANSWSIVGKSAINGTAGTFNLSTGAFSSTSSTLSSTSINGDSDLWLIPAVYTVSVNYTLSRANGYSSTFTQSADVTLVGGKVNNITANITKNPAVGITFTVSVTDWASQNVVGTFE